MNTYDPSQRGRKRSVSDVSGQALVSSCPDENWLNKKLDKLNGILGSPFSDNRLLKLALTHRSAGPNNYERLEFLGDSIISFVIADNLYNRFPTAREGQMSRLRASLVNGETLAEIAREFNLGDYLIMGSGELKSGGYKRASILSDTFEALIGAIYLDRGMSVTRERLDYWFQSRIENLSLEDTQKDPKTVLQEYLQSRGSDLPQYTVVCKEGRAHDQIFTVSCLVELLKNPTSGSGGTRRQAEQAAAAVALEHLTGVEK